MSLCPIKAYTMGRSTPLRPTDSQKYGASLMKGKIRHIRLAYCMRKRCAKESVRYGLSTRVRNAGPSADILILTACNVAVNTPFISTLRLSPFLA